MSLTPRDIEILSMAMQCLKEPAKVDYAKLSTLGGFKNTASASAVYGAVKKKLEGLGGVNASAASTNPKKSTPKGKGKPAGPTNEDENADDNTATEGAANGVDEATNSNEEANTPSTKPAAKKRAPKVKAANNVDEATNSNDETTTPATKPAPKKRAPKAKAAAIKPEDTIDAAGHDNNITVDTEAATNNNTPITTPTTKPAPKKRAPKKTPTSALKTGDASPTNGVTSDDPTANIAATPTAKKRIRKPKDLNATPAKRVRKNPPVAKSGVDPADQDAATEALAIMAKNDTELKDIGDTNTFLGNEMGGQHMDYDGSDTYATEAVAGFGEDGPGGEDGVVGYADENVVGVDAMMDASQGDAVGVDEGGMTMGGALEMYGDGH